MKAIRKCDGCKQDGKCPALVGKWKVSDREWICKTCTRINGRSRDQQKGSMI